MKVNDITKVSIEKVKEFFDEHKERSKRELITTFKYLVDILKAGIWHVWIEETNNICVISKQKPQGKWQYLKSGSRKECESYCRKKGINFEIMIL